MPRQICSMIRLHLCYGQSRQSEFIGGKGNAILELEPPEAVSVRNDGHPAVKACGRGETISAEALRFRADHRQKVVSAYIYKCTYAGKGKR